MTSFFATLIIWGNPDPINALILLVYAIMAYFMWRTFKEGQRQSGISLSLGQYNILNKELDNFIIEAKDIKFTSWLPENLITPYKNSYQIANGIYYIQLFDILERINNGSFHDNDEKDILVDDFRTNVIFPLQRFYNKVEGYINRLMNDNIINNEHRIILLYYIERDLLQTYFRICNYELLTTIKCDLSILETVYFKKESFYRINEIYKKNNLFNFKNLDFYKSTF